MFPIIWSGYGLVIPSWHVMVALSACISYVTFIFLTRKKNIKRFHLLTLCSLIYITALIGARSYSLILENEYGNILDYSTGLSLYGAIIATIVVSFFYCSYYKINFYDILDSIVITGFVAIAIGRIGCFLNGDDYGKIIPPKWQQSWWTLTLTINKNSLARYPIQLIESCSLTMCIPILIYIKKYCAVGISALIGLLIYAIQRYGLEFWRDEANRYTINDTISTAQISSIILIVISTTLIFYKLLDQR